MHPKAPFADCSNCPLQDEHFVPGFGRRQTGRVIVGLAPGDEEVRQGKPFMGSAGERLNQALGSHSGIGPFPDLHHEHGPLPTARPQALVRGGLSLLQQASPRGSRSDAEAGSRLGGDRRCEADRRPTTGQQDAAEAIQVPGLGRLRIAGDVSPGRGNAERKELGEPFDKDVGWLMKPAAGPFEPGREAGIRDLCEQGHSAYEIGQIVGLTEAQVRRILDI